MAEMIKANGNVVGKPEGRRQLGNSGRTWEDNIKTDIEEIGCRGVDWIHVSPDRIPVMNVPISLKSKNFLAH
jgi:hypothetical protein